MAMSYYTCVFEVTLNRRLRLAAWRLVHVADLVGMVLGVEALRDPPCTHVGFENTFPT